MKWDGERVMYILTAIFVVLFTLAVSTQSCREHKEGPSERSR